MTSLCGLLRWRSKNAKKKKKNIQGNYSLYSTLHFLYQCHMVFSTAPPLSQTVRTSCLIFFSQWKKLMWFTDYDWIFHCRVTKVDIRPFFSWATYWFNVVTLKCKTKLISSWSLCLRSLCRSLSRSCSPNLIQEKQTKHEKEQITRMFYLLLFYVHIFRQISSIHTALSIILPS